MVKLNLGCGEDVRKGYVNCDICFSVGVDHVFDLEKKFPFKDNVFDEVLALKIIEHLHDPRIMMKEIWRVSKNKARVKILAPHTSNISMEGCLSHFRTGINSLSFNQYLEENKWSFDKIERFKIIKYSYVMNPILYKHIFWKLFRRFFLRFFSNRLQGFLVKHQRFTESWLSKWYNLGNFYIELEVVK